MAAAFPPRGGIRLLAPEHTRLGGSAASRLVAEECMLDTITFFDGDRIECAARLGKGDGRVGVKVGIRLCTSVRLRVPPSARCA